MPKKFDEQPSPWPVRTVVIVANLTVAICAVVILSAVVGINGLRITQQVDDVTAAMTIRGDLVENVDLTDRLPFRMVDDDGTVTSAGLGRIDFAGPTNVAVVMFAPTPSQRVIWLIPRVLGPLLVAAVAWLVRAMAKSAMHGDPFTAANERRLWRIATLIAAGGTFMAMVDGMVDTLLTQRSAAADLFTMSFDISFMPIIVGLVIAALASVWRVGIGLSDDAAATI